MKLGAGLDACVKLSSPKTDVADRRADATLSLLKVDTSSVDVVGGGGSDLNICASEKLPKAKDTVFFLLKTNHITNLVFESIISLEHGEINQEKF